MHIYASSFDIGLPTVDLIFFNSLFKVLYNESEIFFLPLSKSLFNKTGIKIPTNNTKIKSIKTLTINTISIS